MTHEGPTTVLHCFWMSIQSAWCLVDGQERWDRAGTEFIGSSGSKDQAGEERAKRYLPFSTGPRQCIGQSLAHMMHDVGVAVLLSHFHFQLAPKARSSPCL